MFLYFGEENALRRQVKINWLKTHFNDQSVAQPVHGLAQGALNDNRSFVDKLLNKKEKLIISGHGNDASFQGRSATDLYNTLILKGLNHQRFDSVYLLGCNIGDATVHQNFLRDFGTAVRTGNAAANQLKVYGPRGLIGWTFSEHSVDGVTRFERVETCEIITPTARYTFATGLLLWQP